MELKEYVKRCGESANKKGWVIKWEDLPEYLLATIDELCDGFERGWRNDDQKPMETEIADCLVRLFHICHDLNIDIETVLQEIMKENESRSYKHGHKRI